MIDDSLEHTADLYEPIGTTSAAPYVKTATAFPCLIEPKKSAWRKQVDSAGQFAGRIYLMTFGPDITIYDHCRVYWPLQNKTFEVQFEADDTNRSAGGTTIPEYQTCELKEAQVAHL